MITIKEDQVTPYLSNIASRLKDTTPLMRELSEQLLKNVKENFTTEGQSLLGTRWQALKPATIKSKMRRNRPLTILQDSSRLYSTISASFGSNFAMAGTNKVYAATHQFGNTINQAARSELFERLRNKKGKFKKLKSPDKREFKKGFTFGARTIVIPARPFLGIGTAQRNVMVKTIKDFIAAGGIGQSA